MISKTALLLLSALAIVSCKTDFSSKAHLITTTFGKIEARLKALEEKTVESRELYFVYGSVTIESTRDQNIGVDLNNIVLTINGRNSESCYVDSVASYVSPITVLKSEKKTLDVYWIFDKMVDLKIKQTPEISIHYRE